VTLWISNFVAYSVQLTVLVGAAAGVAALLRIHRPVAALRFWQGVFAVALLWPACQVWGHGGAAANTPAGQVFTSVADWSLSTSVAQSAVSNPAYAWMIVTIVGAGALFRLTLIAFGVRELRALREASVPAPSLALIAGELQNELATDADIRFATNVTSPATFGAARPTVLLPQSVDRLPGDVQRAILCHELMHVRRRDWLLTVGEELWCSVLWFHPAARALTAQLAFVRETVVDQATIAYTRDRRAYAAALLAFATADPPVVGAAALIGRRSFERRIALISQEAHMDAKGLSLRLCVAAFVVAAATIAATVAVPLNVAVAAQTQKIYKAGGDVTVPRVVKEVKPGYTPEAMRAKIQGSVWLSAVVLPSGDVGDVTVSTSLDKEHGLDEQAVQALKQWKFEPGRKGGEAVAVEVTVQMTFTLKK
jgi:TonB family protein